MNFMKLYIGDYQRDTGHLTIAEHGAYLLMLQHYYATEKPLPTGRALHRLLRAETRADREAIDSIAAQFWTSTDAGLVNGRADEEIRKAEHQRSVNQAIGKRGGRPKQTESKTDSVSDSLAIRNPHQTPDTRHQTKEEDKDAAGAADVWAFGVDLLTRECGLGQGTARSYIGALCRSWPEGTVLDALMAAAGKADPKAYARKWLEDKPKKGVRAKSAAEELMAEMGVSDATH